MDLPKRILDEGKGHTTFVKKGMLAPLSHCQDRNYENKVHLETG